MVCAVACARWCPSPASLPLPTAQAYLTALLTERTGVPACSDALSTVPRLGAPRLRTACLPRGSGWRMATSSGRWAPRHRLGRSREPPSKSPIPPPRLRRRPLCARVRRRGRASRLRLPGRVSKLEGVTTRQARYTLTHSLDPAAPARAARRARALPQARARRDAPRAAQGRLRRATAQPLVRGHAPRRAASGPPSADRYARARQAAGQGQGSGLRPAIRHRGA